MRGTQDSRQRNPFTSKMSIVCYREENLMALHELEGNAVSQAQVPQSSLSAPVDAERLEWFIDKLDRA